MPSVDWNRREWNDLHGWDREGDEWNGMAAHCDQPYGAWKAALIDTFLAPHWGEDRHVLEIAPGHGRWASHTAPEVGALTLVDLSPNCIEACRERLREHDHVSFVVNDGSSLPGVADGSVDFVWSFDSFVHMELSVIQAYLAEIARVLRPGGAAVLHHADKRKAGLRLVPVTSRLGRAGKVLLQLVAQGRLRDGGNRGHVTRADVSRAAGRHGLAVSRQTDRWGPSGEYTVTKYRDVITVLEKPAA